MPTLSIRAKLVLAIVATLGASGIANAILVRSLYLGSARAASEEALRGAAAAYEELERNDIERLSTALDILVQVPTLRDAFAARDRDRLQAATLPFHKVLKADHGIGHWNYIEPETRRMFLRPHLPNKYGDVIERVGLLRAIARQETSFGKELGKSAFALRVGRPFPADGKIIGYIELGEEIDHFLNRMKSQTGNDFAMYIKKSLIDQGEWARTRGTARNTWNDFADYVVVNSTTTDPIVDQAALSGDPSTGRILDESEREGSVFARGTFPVRDAAGNVVGGLVARHDITALYQSMRTEILKAIAFMVCLALVASALVFLLVDRLIFRRLKAMVGTMEELSTRLAGGDYSVGATVGSARQDEIGKFETFFGEFLTLVGNTVRGLADRLRQQQGRPATRPAAPPPPAR